MKNFLKTFFVSFFLITLITPVVASGLGVGIGTGKISIDEELRNGMTYNFPSLVVINTGDRASNYTLDISYNRDQAELLPPRDWFTFTPEVFFLEPGESQQVEIRMRVPVDNVVPGDYFAYLEAKPVIEPEEGVTAVGVSVAAKLNFTIAPSNFFQGLYYRLRDIFIQYQPWSIILTTLIGLFILRAIFTKFFSFDLNVKPKKKEDQKIKKDE